MAKALLPNQLGRRELLRIGALSVLGGLAPRQAAMAAPAASKRRSCIFMLLQGGPSQHDLWDPKPAASENIRGPFGTIGTAVPALRFGELLPGSAKVAGRLCVVRSMTHQLTNHIAGTYVTLTGSDNTPDVDREADPDDLPGPGAVLNYLQRATPAVPRAVALPNWLTIPIVSNRMPGQFGGFLGSVHDPLLIEGDPSAAGYSPLSLSMPDGLSAGRMRERLDLLGQLDRAARLLERDLRERYDYLQQSAYEMVVDGRVRRALDLSQEPAAVRDRYGRTKIGQSLLLARRLVEAGVQFVAYNAYHQRWDTHSGQPTTYREIVPPMDAAFSTLIDDLAARNLLDDTLVINTGEFGRTPQMNEKAGRDHWPNVYSAVLAGGGVRGGMIYGASDGQGAEVTTQPVSPADILATMYRQLGISPKTQIRDRLNRPMQLSDGRVLEELL